MSDDTRVLWHQSGVNPKGEPFVQLLLGEEVIAQLDMDMAREHALAMLEACEASEQDAFLLQYLMRPDGGIELSIEQAMAILVRYREWRAERGKRGGPSRARDWVMPPGKERQP